MKIIRVKRNDAKKDGVYRVGDYDVTIEDGGIMYVDGIHFSQVDKKFLRYLEKQLKI